MDGVAAMNGKSVNDQPEWVCAPCGDKYGRFPEGRLSTWHGGTCGVCGKKAPVTEPRDFGYLRVDWKIEKEIKS